ncbi:MAG: isoprenylcysteine carboxylmethyltransferase family protein [Hyphomicrobiaceae bacterium]|nr:isoprenylcysteine carboxylmethyltransferase family protein [Hyphomicrobiaceae bacterium]
MGISETGSYGERPSAFPWPPVLFGAALLLALGLGRLWPLPWPGLDDLPARLVGYGFGIAGIVLSAWALLTLQRARTNILPNRAAGRLITWGPYRVWRHPIYMAEVLMMLGLAQVTGNVWFAIAAALFTVLVLALAIVPEERHLEARFGEDFEAYRARSRRWF